MTSFTFEKFIASYPGYTDTSYLDRLRELDYKRLEREKQVYLDYTGGGLYADSQEIGRASCRERV